jgi:hypothetical protein
MSAADGIHVDTERLDLGRRRIWQRVIIATLVVAAIAIAAFWWEQRGFDPGDTIDVTATVQACGRLNIETRGDQWISEGQDVLDDPEGTALPGTLERLSNDVALFVPELDDLQIRVQRIRSDYFVTLGCRIE